MQDRIVRRIVSRAHAVDAQRYRLCHGLTLEGPSDTPSADRTRRRSPLGPYDAADWRITEHGKTAHRFSYPRQPEPIAVDLRRVHPSGVGRHFLRHSRLGRRHIVARLLRKPPHLLDNARIVILREGEDPHAFPPHSFARDLGHREELLAIGYEVQLPAATAAIFLVAARLDRGDANGVVFIGVHTEHPRSIGDDALLHRLE